MIKSEFMSVLEEAVVNSGGALIGVSVGADGKIQAVKAGSFTVDSADELSRELISLAVKVISAVCNKVGKWPELRQSAAVRQEAYATIKTFDLKVAAAILKLSSYTLGEMAKKGVVPSAKIGRRWVFTDEGLAEYLREEIRQQTARRRKEPLLANKPTQVERAPVEFTRTGRRKPRPPPPLGLWQK